jgi:signal transduction histidine kinase/ActR/RegA family two-component response regulator
MDTTVKTFKHLGDMPKLGGDLVNMKYKHKPVAYTVKAFAQKYSKGNFILTVEGHALAIKNGVVVDLYTDKLEKLLYLNDKILESKIEDVLPEKIVKITYEGIKSVFSSGEIYIYNYSLKINNSLEYFESRIVPHNSESVIIIKKCITDLVCVRDNAVKERAYLYKVLDNSTVGVAEISDDGRVIFINKELKRILGIDAVIDTARCPICDNIIKEKWDSFDEMLADLRLIEIKEISYVANIKNNKNEYLDLNIRIMLIDNDISNKEEMFFYVKDVTNYIEVQNKLGDSLTRLDEIQEISRISYWQYDIVKDVISGYDKFMNYFPNVSIGNEISSSEFLNIIYSEDRNKLNYFFENLTFIKRTLREQFRIVVGNKICWVEFRSQLCKGKDKDKCDRVYGSIQDITLQKNQEAELYENKKFQETLMEKIPVAVYVKDALTRKYSIWNRAAEELFEICKEDVLGKVDTVFKNRNAEIINKRDDLTLESGISLEFFDEEYYIGNNVKYINSVQVPVSVHGEVQAILGISIDMTEKKLVEKQMIEARNQAEKSDKLKSSFLANMSHEIRNPMNAIVGFSKILIEDENLSKVDKEEFIGLINANAQQLLVLISDIIDIAKIESNKLKIFKNKFNLNKCLNSLYPTYKHQMKTEDKNSVDLKMSVSLLDDNCDIETDEQRLIQILNNLVSNAIRFTSEGEIEFGYVQDSPFELKFYVRDTGSGINKSDIESIFSEFHQVGDVNARKGGKGLGLSISKQLVQYLGGSIWVESEYGVGSTFYFTLPQSSITKKKIVSREVKLLQRKDNVFDWSDRKILVVDDSPDILSFVSILLRKTKVQMCTAVNGQDALDVMKEIDGKVDAVLMDIQMPVMNGVDSMNAIKGMWPNVSVFAQTAFALERDEAKFLAEGFDDYVSKPINKKSLIEKLSVVFENNK